MRSVITVRATAREERGVEGREDSAPSLRDGRERPRERNFSFGGEVAVELRFDSSSRVAHTVDSD